MSRFPVPSSTSRPLEECVARLEAAWQTGAIPSLGDFVIGEGRARLEILTELMLVDLEFRCRAGLGPRLEMYLKQFPELGLLDTLSPEIVAEEYRARRRFADLPTRAEYRARFPRHGAALEVALDRVESELAAEGEAVAEAPTVDWPALATPLDFGDFALKRQIGAGGMCRVYTAVQRSLDRPAAVKILKRRYRDDPLAASRFLLEEPLTRKARHPNVVQMYGAGALPAGGAFLVLELISGQDLSRILAAGPLPPARAAGIVASAAETMAHVHRSGVVHCDLKPANLLSSAGRIVVSDFGLARTFGVDVGEPVLLDRIAGTPAFMAPEQLRADWQPDPSADIYGLGGVLAALLTGQAPAHGPIPFPLDTPEQVRRACLRSLDADPAARPMAGELARLLRS